MTSVMTTCNLYRTFDDMTDNWESLQSVFRYYTSYNPTIYNYSMPGSFNDPDQVTQGFQRLYFVEYGCSSYAHFMWHIQGGPRRGHYVSLPISSDA